ncbi:MAG TPA: LysM peptidoglycan-binding domain-containing protein [Kiritimatiellia bacterium]|nr:LysM peptidoglycan-binding domain-containing protein [Kiritimatiellia bacterium]HMP32951.1 LysM peptidoglycan-binding domain-containing protein [Kiritimatiellia bacterium]
MKVRVFFQTSLAAAALLAASGCIVDPAEQRRVAQQQTEDSLILQEDLRRIRARLESLESDFQRLQQQVSTSNNDLARANQSQLAGFNATLDELNKRIRAVDAAREADKREIVDSLSKKISTMMSTAPARSSSPSQAAPRRAVSNEGYEHVVGPGETLSAIAKAYGARTEDIIQANGLKSADVLRVGQKLFIPAR